ncbi:hypothetical protein [Enterovibrio norvegicus]|uniref:Uncharacterized protein n=1 Tax=Enterovibrio norvegicus TaxID=188144 RepID=A0ABV4LA49_9GAMM|nr:hypothetical protein [Enterovibrio norvegicus]OEF55149.1 hypothetical protein A1OU_22475 [Enterovibrio norvegicus]
MLRLNKSDEEVLAILKEAFFTKKLKPLYSDDHLRFFILRALLYVSIISLATKVGLSLYGKVLSDSDTTFLMTPITIFSSVLFLHINNKSKTFSVIIMMLTWIFLQISLYA